MLPTKKFTVRRGLVTAAVALGALLGGAGLANAAVNAVSADTPAAVSAVAQVDDTETTVVTDDNETGTEADGDCDREHGEHEGDGHGRGHHGGERGDEVELTGDVADQVTAAAEAAVPGGTVERVESDGDGATYEAHVVDADGNEVTVTFDDAFAVVEIVQGR